MSPKVLIVDDEPDVLESTALLAESLGYEALRVSKASEILQTAEEQLPDVILQDLKMPDLNVSGLVASLRSNRATQDIPIVFFSANEDLPGTAARYDAWGHLAKPFGKRELAHVLDQALAHDEQSRPRRGREIQREVRSIFHDYWNLIAAVNNYVVILGEAQDLPPGARKSVDGLDELILQLEAKTDRLQSYLMGLISFVEAAPPPVTGSGSTESVPG